MSLTLDLALLAAILSNQAVNPPEVSVTVRTDRLERAIPRDFLGLAVEKEQLNSGELAPGNRALVQLLRGLGEGTLRIGGSSTEYTSFVQDLSKLPEGRAHKNKRTIGPDQVKNLFQFARSVRWKVIYSLDLGQYNPDTAVEEAKYVNSVSHGALMALEIGNEPDMFQFLGYRPTGWGSAAFVNEFGAYRAALRTSAPTCPLSGPGVGNFMNGPRWLTKLVGSEPKTLAFTSTHFYPMVRTDGLPSGSPTIPDSSPIAPSIPHLLSPRIPTWAFGSFFVPEMRASAAANLPFRITEINTVARGGKTGVSDVFASALWILDYCYRFLELGADGVNVTTDLPVGSVYSAIQVENGIHVARPIYYGMLCFHQGALGRVAPTEVDGEGSKLNFSAYATVGSGQTVRVTLINKESTAVRVHIQIPGDHHQLATVLRLSAPSLDSLSGVELGGAGVAPDGTWRPKSSEAIDEESGAFTLSLPAGSAALLITGSGTIRSGLPPTSPC
jgi:hypothetical protein